jgi:hypothetical protein
MTKQLKRLLILIHLSLLGFFLSITLSGCLLGSQIEIVTGGEERDYSFNSATILESINQGNMDVFNLLSITPVPKSPPSVESVLWGQNDFFRIAQAVNKQAWGESLDAQNFWSMSFSMDCSEIDRKTFSNAIFDSFRVIQTGGKETRIEYHTNIFLAENWVHTSKTEYTPNAHDMKPIDPAKYRIPAEEALQIAEKNGGSKIRLEVDNTCQIDALTPDLNGKGWRVMYQDPHNLIGSIFEITIDPQTGEFKVLKAKP